MAALATASIVANGGIRFRGPKRRNGLSECPWFQSRDPLSVGVGWILDPSQRSDASHDYRRPGRFIFSTGYMAEDPHSGRFFCFIPLRRRHAGADLSNSLLLLFVCWNSVGLIPPDRILVFPPIRGGRRKAFLTTQIGDLGFLVGLIWIYPLKAARSCSRPGGGCLEPAALSRNRRPPHLSGIAVGTAISLLLFCRAMGKSGRFRCMCGFRTPWKADSRERPDPAATMVAMRCLFINGADVPRVVLGGSLEDPASALVVICQHGSGALTALYGA